MRASLLKNIKKYISLTNEEEKNLKESFQTVYVPKKTHLLEAGKICDFEAFVVSGCFRVYILDEKGQEHVLYFAIEDWWLADLDSYNHEKPSLLYMEALEDSEVLWIPKNRKEALYDEIKEFECMFRKMTQVQCVALQRRIIQNLSMNAEERYIDFCTRYPKIRARLTNLHIAAYLGISAEFLSKIRKKISQ